MIETILYNYLNDPITGASVPVYLMRPPTPPQKYIIIEKTGSSRNNYIDMATIAVQSYAPTLYEAAELNEEAKGLMLNAIELPEISSSKLQTDYNFTNTASKQPRYQAVFQVTYF